ncbi:MAG: oxygen-dependent coproporphyrinogen oxidase [Ferruginibacter sp.]
MDIKQRWITMIQELQNNVCSEIERVDGKALFVQDTWDRPEGGGGKTRIIEQGNVFEKGGVNTSVVYGMVNESMRTQLNIEGSQWFAAGISTVLHPVNPFVPTVHCNYRMFEVYDEQGGISDRWFGGGTDLTPFYLFNEDAVHFHQSYKNVCDKFDPSFYFIFKKNCDNYFVNKHRDNERRGIGGIFYDYQRITNEKNINFWLDFGAACGTNFLSSYIPIVEKRKNTRYDASQKHWQEIRRGRYVEFNLIHDRGTLFGLKSGGRIESILMSLPPVAKFEYNYYPEIGSEEERLLKVCMHPVDWLTDINEQTWATHANTC